jgi:hypothetical protein
MASLVLLCVIETDAPMCGYVSLNTETLYVVMSCGARLVVSRGVSWCFV